MGWTVEDAVLTTPCSITGLGGLGDALVWVGKYHPDVNAGVVPYDSKHLPPVSR